MAIIFAYVFSGNAGSESHHRVGPPQALVPEQRLELVQRRIKFGMLVSLVTHEADAAVRQYLQWRNAYAEASLAAVDTTRPVVAWCCRLTRIALTCIERPKLRGYADHYLDGLQKRPSIIAMISSCTIRCGTWGVVTLQIRSVPS